MNGQWIWGVVVLLGVIIVFGGFFVAFNKTTLGWYKERYGKDYRKMFWKDTWTGWKNFFKNLTWKDLLPWYTKKDLHKD